jgi:hypothetical protein
MSSIGPPVPELPVAQHDIPNEVCEVRNPSSISPSRPHVSHKCKKKNGASLSRAANPYSKLKANYYQ